MKKLIIILFLFIFANMSFSLTFDSSICFAVSPLSTVKPQDLDKEKTRAKFCIDSECKNYTELGIRYSSDWGKHCMDGYAEDPPLHYRYRYYKFMIAFKNGKVYETDRINPEAFKNYYKITIGGKKISIKALMPEVASCYDSTCPTEVPQGLYYEINCEKTKECITDKSGRQIDGHEDDKVYHMDCNDFLSEEKCPNLYGDDRYMMADKLVVLAETLKTTPYDAGYKSKCKLSNFSAEDNYCKAWSVAGHLEEDLPKNCFKKAYPAKKDKELYNKLIYKFQSCIKDEIARKERERKEFREKEIKNPGQTAYCLYYYDEDICPDTPSRGVWAEYD